MEIARSYDTMPYPSKFFVKTHPDHLATLAEIFGMEAKNPENCRVLELGCGNGSNLISHAYSLKDSHFVGIDISSKHIKQAKKWAEELDIENVEFYELDLMKMDTETFGKFDYIVAHGLISWIPDFVRERVFDIYEEMLAPNGIGYLSYNALPGSHIRNMVREIMRFHTRGIEEPLEKLQESIKFLSLVTEHTNERKIFQSILDFELNRHFQRDPSDIYHDDLSECYRPFYFHEFAQKLDEHDLQYLSEAEFFAMFGKNYSPEIQEFINQKEDLIEREQYLDLFCGRSFRQTVFCRQEVELNRNIDAKMLDRFYVGSPLKPESENIELTSHKAEKFKGQQNLGIEIEHPPTKTALHHLSEIWGKSIAMPELLQTARQKLEDSDYKTEDWEKEFGITRAIMYQIIQTTDLIKLRSRQIEADQEAGETPQLNKLNRWQLGIGDNVTTPFGFNISIDDEVSKKLLELLDGTRGRDELFRETSAYIKTFDAEEQKKYPLDNLDGWLDKTLAELGKFGIFD